MMTLIEAADAGDLALVLARIESGEDVKARDPAGLTALHRAAAGGHLAVVRSLLDAGADPNAPSHQPTPESPSEPMALGATVIEPSTEEGASALGGLLGRIWEASRGKKRKVLEHTALAEAVANGHEEIVELLLERGAAPDVRDAEGFTALTLAVAKGHRGIVEALVRIGADPEPLAADGMNSLMIAAGDGRLDLVRILLAAGADPNASSKVLMFTLTPLGMALQEGHREVADALIAAGARCEASPLEMGIALRKAVEADDREALRALIVAGVDLLSPTGGGDPLQTAAAKGHTEMIRLLIEAGVPPDIPSRMSGKTALMVAAENGQAGAADVLLQAGADVNRPVKDGGLFNLHVGSTALTLAAWGGHAEVVRQLIVAGADPDSTDGEGRTPAELAAAAGHGNALAEFGFADALPPRVRDACLVSAARLGNAAEVARLIAAGATPDARAKVPAESVRRPALVHAALGGHLATVRVLLESGADVAAPSEYDGLTALMAASAGGVGVDEAGDEQVSEVADLPGEASPNQAEAAGYLEVIRRLLEAGADPNARADVTGDAMGGRTALMIAAERGQVEAARALLLSGASVHVKDTPASWERGTGPAGQTALAYAVRNGHVEVVDLLLDAGSQIEARNMIGETPLMLAASSGNLQLVERLLAAGADAGARDWSGGTAFAAATSCGNPAIIKLLDVLEPPTQEASSLIQALNMAIFEYKPDLVKDLLARTKDINAHAPDGSTALFTAVMMGRQSLVRRLLDLGADPDTGKEDGESALSRAAATGHVGILRLLLDAGADPMTRSKWGRTPVLELVHDYRRNPMSNAQSIPECLRMLIAAGVDLDARDDDGRAALQVATAGGHDDLAAILREAGASTAGVAEEELRRAADEGDVGRVRELIAAGADVNTPGPHGHTTLMAAANRGHVEVVRLLLESGADPRAEADSHYCALYSAIWNGHAEVARILIEAGAEVNVATGNPPRPLLADAVMKKNREVVGLLLAAGARPDTSTGYFGSPILNSAVSDHHMVRMLLEAGADLNAADEYFHQTPLHRAAFDGKVESIRYLLAAGADPLARDKKGETPRDHAEAQFRAEAAEVLRTAEVGGSS